MTPWVADYSIARPGGAALRNAGVGGVKRYTGAYRYDGAVVDAAEWADLQAHGIQVGLVCEYSANWLMNGYAWCKQIAQATRALETKLGIPPGMTSCAADWDVTLGGPPVSGQALSNCERSLDGIHGYADGYGGWQYVEPYGSKWFCEWACANSPMTSSWSAQAWSWVNGAGFQPAINARLWQYAAWPAGVPFVSGCDFNLIRGAWNPRTTAPPPPPPKPTPPSGDIVLKTLDLTKSHDFAAPDMRTLRGLLCAWKITVDGVLITPDDSNSDRTRRGLKQFQTLAGLKADEICGTSTWNVLLAGVKA